MRLALAGAVALVAAAAVAVVLALALQPSHHPRSAATGTFEVRSHLPATASGAGPNAVQLKPPPELSNAQRVTFFAGAAIAAESGCEGCHVIGHNGNDGPGRPLTHIGASLRPAAIASALRNPKAPMPSFADLASTSPKQFGDLVQFLAMLK